MEAYLLDWLNLFGRWLHITAGIAWIGASFYFVFLDTSLLPPKLSDDKDKGVGGELWAVHGGGFYHVQKYRVAPRRLPEPLHWFKWEAYTTWLSGMFMLALIYWHGASIYLIDPSVAALSPAQGIGLSIAFLAGGWLIYDQLCKSRLGDNDVALGVVVFVLVALAAYGLCHLFSGRAAYILYGAMLGTIMVANVFFVIIPGQRELVAAKQEGREPDPSYGLKGKQRSVHNTYFTLPVLFAMISNHYAMTYGNGNNWLILIGLSLAGALIRVYFVARHRGRASPLPAVLAVAVLAAVVVAIAPPVSTTAAATARPVGFNRVASVIHHRCAVCHAAKPAYAGFTAPPKGIMLQTPAEIRQHARQIYQQAVVTKVMPLGNLTHISNAERALLGQWFKQRQQRQATAQ